MSKLDLGDYNDSFSSYFEYIRDLGEGSYGKVVKARDKYTNKICAVKVLMKNKLSDSFLRKLRNEASLLSALDHPNIVKFYSVKESNSRIFISMEYLRGGTLSSLLITRRLSDKSCAKIMKSLLCGVKYLHKNSIIHRDLKPDNILFQRRSDLSTLKIADFGMCIRLEPGSTSDEKAGTILYMSPEQAASKPYGKPVDIWSLGIILYKIINKGKHPLYTPQENIENFWNRLKRPQWVFTSGFNDLSKSLFLNLVKIDPIERYSADMALMHPWITEENKEIPKTHIEKLRIFDSEIKLRTIFFTCFFASIAANTGGIKNKEEIVATIDPTIGYHNSRTVCKSVICRSPQKMTIIRARTIIK